MEKVLVTDYTPKHVRSVVNTLSIAQKITKIFLQYSNSINYFSKEVTNIINDEGVSF